MLYRSIYIGNPAYLKLKDKQLKVSDPKTKEEKGSVPIEDIGLLMLDHYQITLSHQLIQELMKNNVILISCDERHLPLARRMPRYISSVSSNGSLSLEKQPYLLSPTSNLKEQRSSIAKQRKNHLKIVFSSLFFKFQKAKNLPFYS